MAWKKITLTKDTYQEVWVSIGKEREDYYPLLEGQTIMGYFEKLNHSEKFEQPILSLISEDRKTKYLLFCPPDLERKASKLEEEAGKGVLTKITYLGKENITTKDGRAISIHRFDVEYDSDVRLDTLSG